MLGRVEGGQAGKLGDVGPVAVLVDGHERYVPGYLCRVVRPAGRAGAAWRTRNRMDLAGDAAAGIRLAEGGGCWRDARYLDGIAPATVLLTGHVWLVYPAGEIGGRYVTAARYAVACRNAPQRGELAEATVQCGEARKLAGLAPAPVPFAGHEHSLDPQPTPGALRGPVSPADGAADRR